MPFSLCLVLVRDGQDVRKHNPEAEMTPTLYSAGLLLVQDSCVDGRWRLHVSNEQKADDSWFVEAAADIFGASDEYFSRWLKIYLDVNS